MFITAINGEEFVKEYDQNGVFFEVVRCPVTVWCGAVGYAPNCEEEPDIASILVKYQSSIQERKRETANPQWDCAISINYWQEGAAPRGMMFGQQVMSVKQASVYDVYTMPESLFVRVSNTAENAKAAFGKESCEVYELFGVIKDHLDEHGYDIGTNGAQEIEMYNHSAGISYAYVQVKQKEI